MIASLRKEYNRNFSEEKYRDYIKALEETYPGQLDFRVAETPLFIPADFKNKMLDACDSIVNAVMEPSYLNQSGKALPPGLSVSRPDTFPHFIAFDFGICEGSNGVEPQLIEMQGFPSLFCWQAVLPRVHEKIFGKPAGFTPYLGGLDEKSYIALLKEIIVAGEDPEQVILLEILPHQQKTRIDFQATKDLLGIEIVCLSEVYTKGNKLFYKKQGREINIMRIFNRVIFDDLHQQPAELQEKGKIFQQDLDLTWLPHPDWFFRISKFSLPFIQHPYVPETRFLSDPGSLISSIDKCVIKPLFSFAGQGVIIEPTEKDVAAVKDPENWIIQKKVAYAPVIETPDENAKAEIRIFYFWPPGAEKPMAVNNLCRLSKGKMVGVRYNKDKTWVGGSFCLFES